MVVKLGEVQSEMTDDVKKTDDLKVILKVEWKDKIKEIKFNPSLCESLAKRKAADARHSSWTTPEAA